MKQRHGKLVGAVLGLVIAGAATAQVIVQSPYRPPETVQPVAVPLSPSQQRLNLLIISGRSSYEHDWTGVNNLLRKQLQDSGRFDVRIVEDFDHGSAELLKSYDVVLLNYLGRWNYTDPLEKRWSPAAEKALFDYVRNGGGIVVYHASFNMGSPGWPEFEKLAGGVMRPQAKSRRSPPGGFLIHITDRDHPVTRGMREYFWTFNDDMYTNMQFDPDVKIHVLATAHDSSAGYAPEKAGPKYPAYAYTPAKLKQMKGMDADHPQAWTADYGNGRVFAIPLGHGPDTLQYPGVRGLIARGAEWAATGKVTIPVETDIRDFPIERDEPTAK
ncbi:ThuA domain-containing protein [Sphingobium sp.]|uniref:ThuA domain-containing protein n=1 Tax=Sphingobium sp. TaxID=1912891 RepID=UPI0035C70BD8